MIFLAAWSCFLVRNDPLMDKRPITDDQLRNNFSMTTHSLQQEGAGYQGDDQRSSEPKVSLDLVQTESIKSM